MLGVPEIDGQLPCSEAALALFSLVMFEQNEAVYAAVGKAPAVDPAHLDQAVDDFLAYLDRLERAAPEVAATLSLESMKERVQKRVHERMTLEEEVDADQR